MVTKVDIVTSDDGGSCDPDCPHLFEYVEDKTMGCDAFKKPIVNMSRTIGCMGREDVGYQIPVVEE